MNVIWIVADTVRTDAVAAYGNKKIHTPALDALAARGVRFDRHYIASFPTMPCLLYTSPSPRDGLLSRMPSSA